MNTAGETMSSIVLLSTNSPMGVIGKTKHKLKFFFGDLQSSMWRGVLFEGHVLFMSKDSKIEHIIRQPQAAETNWVIVKNDKLESYTYSKSTDWNSK